MAGVLHEESAVNIRSVNFQVSNVLLLDTHALGTSRRVQYFRDAQPCVLIIDVVYYIRFVEVAARRNGIWLDF